MISKENEENPYEEPKSLGALLKKLLIWFIVFFIAVMLIMIIVYQPKFFTFVQQTINIGKSFIIKQGLI